MDIKITKKDFFLAVLAGELAALLSFPVLKNLKVFDMLAGRGIGALTFSVFWILFIPAGAIAGLSFFLFFGKIQEPYRIF